MKLPTEGGGIACLSRHCDWLLIVKESNKALKHLFEFSFSVSVHVLYLLKFILLFKSWILVENEIYDSTSNNKNYSGYRRWSNIS